MISPRKHVQHLQRYVAPLEGRRPMLRLDFNENTVGPSPAVVAAIRELPPSAYATYPEYAGLEEVFAEALAVPATHIATFNGVDAAIRAVFDAYGDEGQELLTTDPTFGYYTPCALQQGMKITALPYLDDLSFPFEEMRQSLGNSPRLCFICNPNNPTTTLLPAAKVLELIDSAPASLFVVDELYADFTGVSVLPQSLERDNILVLRSLSKAAGLAALRIGVAVGKPELLDALRRVTGPYDINMFAVVAARAAIADAQYMRSYISEVNAAKAWVVAELQRRRVRLHADGGNFVLVFPSINNAEVVRGLRDQGILVRSMDGKACIDGSFRLTIGTREQMSRFMRVFAAILPAS